MSPAADAAPTAGGGASGAPTAGAWRTWLDLVALWLAAGVLAGATHLLTARALRLGFNVTRWGWESRDLWWRTPLAYVVLFAPVALLLLAAAPLLGRWRVLRLAAWSWITLVLFAVLLLFPQLHGYASLLLAAGAAWRLSAAAARREPGVLRGARLVGWGGALAVALAAAFTPRLRAMGEQRTLAALPAAPAGAPNVLFLILDTVRADYLSVYGWRDQETTPRLAQWARQGVVFDESYSTSSWTTPSHASFFTGQYPSVHGASFTSRLAPSHLTVAEVLQARGWATGGFTANLIATTIESGLAQGFVHYEDYQNSWEEILKSTTITQAHNVLRALETWQEGRPLRAVVRAFLSTDFAPRLVESAHDGKRAEEVRMHLGAWLDGLPAGRPFFAFVNLFDAHAPYHPPEPYASMFLSGGPERKDLARYKGALRYLDDQVALLLDDLARRGALQNTIVIVTSDHGEQFGEHAQDAHANSLYRQVLHVPLMVVAPGRVPAGVRIGRQVTGRDLPATILDLLSVPRDSAIGGTSLAPLWREAAAVAAGDSTTRSATPPAPAATSDVIAELDQNTRPVLRFRNAQGPMKALFDDTLHVIRDGTGVLEAFHYRRDPREATELVAAGRDSLPLARQLQGAVDRHRLRWPAAIPVKGGVRDLEREQP